MMGAEDQRNDVPTEAANDEEVRVGVIELPIFVLNQGGVPSYRVGCPELSFEYTPTKEAASAILAQAGEECSRHSRDEEYEFSRNTPVQ